tara:strand:+ start:186 stop:1142 length:957 start_codon:yes stop_codon:yes gene_type:complete
MPESNKKDKLNPFNTLKLFGLNRYFFDFVKLFKTDKLPKVILLTGEKGIGKFTLSFHLINCILSLDSKNNYDYENQTIDEKNYIYKSILNNVCENFVYISNEGRKKTGIEDIRGVKKKFNTSSLNNLPRFTVLDDVELLNLNAANSLLKLIEEPSDCNYFILINNKRKNIIETIKSRALETKIFLDKKKQAEIFSELLKYYNIDSHFSHDFKNYAAPGKLIRYSENLKNLKIDLDTSLYNSTSILIENFKKTKDDIFLDCINFLLEINFSKKINSENKELINVINEKNNIIKLLYNYKNFNLSSNSVLEFIRRHENYA